MKTKITVEERTRTTYLFANESYARNNKHKTTSFHFLMCVEERRIKGRSTSTLDYTNIIIILLVS